MITLSSPDINIQEVVNILLSMEHLKIPYHITITTEEDKA